MSTLYGTARNDGTYLGFTSHSEFTNGLCDIFATTTSLQEGRQVETANWQCTPICLNALFCPYCLLARQARYVYLEENSGYYYHSSAAYNNNNNTNNNNGADDFSVASPTQQNQNGNFSATGGDDEAETDENNNLITNSSQFRPPEIGTKSNSKNFAATTNNNNQSGAPAGGKLQKKNFSNFSLGSSSPPSGLKSSTSQLLQDDDGGCCSLCYNCFITCPTATVDCLEDRLPPSLHYTCLSAVAIDAASIGVGAAVPVTFFGIWISGLSMQSLLVRTMVRRRLGLANNILHDSLVSTFFPFCVAAQNHMEIEMRRKRNSTAGSQYDGLIFGKWHAPQVMGGTFSGVY